VVRSFAYLAVRSLFGLVLLLGRSDRSKELEILVLRHELTVLRRGSRRPRLEPADRALTGRAESGAAGVDPMPARENPHWGYQWTAGELKGLGPAFLSNDGAQGLGGRGRSAGARGSVRFSV
jgi:hypothetical protein